MVEKAVVVLEEVEQDIKEERMDSVVHRVVRTVVMEILMVMNVEDQVTMPLEEAVVAALKAAGFKLARTEMTGTNFYFSRLLEAERA